MSVLQSQVHDTGHLHRLDLGKRSAKDSKVLGIDVGRTSGDIAKAGHHRVARHPPVGHAKVDGAMGDIGVQFLKAPFVHKTRYPLAGGELALGVLDVNLLLSTAQARLSATSLQLFQAPHRVGHGTMYWTRYNAAHQYAPLRFNTAPTVRQRI